VALDSKIQHLPLALQHRLILVVVVVVVAALELLLKLKQHPLDLLHQLLVALEEALGLQLRLQALEVAVRLALRLLPLPPLVLKEEEEEALDRQ
jgi:hypothetical protein